MTLNVHLVRTVFALIFMWISEFYNVYPRLFVKLVLFNATLIEINEMFKQALNFIVALNVYQFSFIYFSFSFQFLYNSISQNDLVWILLEIFWDKYNCKYKKSQELSTVRSPKCLCCFGIYLQFIYSDEICIAPFLFIQFFPNCILFWGILSLSLAN